MTEHRDAQERASERSEVRGAVVRFLLVGLIALGVLSAPAALLMQYLVREHTLHELRTHTEMMALNLVAPLLDERFQAGDPAALQHLRRVVQGRVADGSVVQISVWNRSGTVLYSSSPDLVGERFADHDWPASLLVGGQTTATLEDHGGPTTLYEHPGGHFVEVDTVFRSAAGEDLIFEAYYPAEIVHGQQRDLLLKLLPVGLGMLLLLQVAQLPSAVRLARQIQGLQVGRRRLMSQAAAASDLERRRIARDLHDDVIQELAGVSYALESIEDRLDLEVQPVMERARDLLRGSVRDLRSMLTEIYPADLDMVGLPQAIDRLADGLRGDGVTVHVELQEDLAVGPLRATLLYRVAREALTNARKHARPTAVTVRMSRRRHGQHGTAVALEVADDGVGFDLPRAQPGGGVADAGHLGLQLIQDAVREAGGAVEVDSAPGAGTRLTATIPLT